MTDRLQVGRSGERMSIYWSLQSLSLDSLRWHSRQGMVSGRGEKSFLPSTCAGAGKTMNVKPKTCGWLVQQCAARRRVRSYIKGQGEISREPQPPRSSVFSKSTQRLCQVQPGAPRMNLAQHAKDRVRFPWTRIIHHIREKKNHDNDPLVHIPCLGVPEDSVTARPFLE
jgi:hypothetical protein